MDTNNIVSETRSNDFLKQAITLTNKIKKKSTDNERGNVVSKHLSQKCFLHIGYPLYVWKISFRGTK